MRVARERGYRLAMLTGTPLALGVFRALGFKDIGRVKLYVWRPPKGELARPGPREEDQRERAREDRDQTLETGAEAERDGWEWVE